MRGGSLALLFGLLTFLQGLAEPTEGLVSQPVRSIVESADASVQRVSIFAAILTIPWVLKPVFGLLIDFFPLITARRRTALIVAGGIWLVVYLVLARRSEGFSTKTLLIWLMCSTFAAAFADVATDALVVDWGQIEHKTGRYQAVIWFASYASGIVTGFLGGLIATHGWIGPAYFACGMAGLVMLGLSFFAIREPPQRTARQDWPDVKRALGEAVRSRGVWTVAGFLFLFNFNPLTNPILQHHITRTLRLSESFFGASLSVFSISAMVAAVVYGWFSSRIPIKRLAYASIGLGIVANLAYAPMIGTRSAIVAASVVGFCYMAATLVQFDLAARVCPPGATATVFASFMAVSNLSTALATGLGGPLYEASQNHGRRDLAFPVLMIVGAATTALAGLIIPHFPRSLTEEPG